MPYVGFLKNNLNFHLEFPSDFLGLFLFGQGKLSSQVANPRNEFCIEQRATEKSEKKRICVFLLGLFSAAPPACAGWVFGFKLLRLQAPRSLTRPERILIEPSAE